MLDIILGTGEKMANETDKPYSHRAFDLVGKTDI